MRSQRTQLQGPDIRIVEGSINSIQSLDTLNITFSKVVLHPEDTVRYGLDDPYNAKDWKNLVPHDREFVLDGQGRRRRVTMFHQLHCLEVLRAEVANPTPRIFSDEAQHCMNYMRQMALCHSRLHLESVRGQVGPKITDLTLSTYVCNDWRQLYV